MRLVLVGAGHAHLHLLARAGALRSSGLDVTLVAPATFDYSGLASGVLSGALASSAARIDVSKLAERQGVTHLPTRIELVDLAGRTVVTADGEAVPFDLLSLNVGSTVSEPAGLAAASEVWPVKPLSRLFELQSQLGASLNAGARTPAILVVGGGQTGFEIAAALAGLCARHGRMADVTVVSRGRARWAPPAALAHLTQGLARRGVRVFEGEAVAREAGLCRLADGRSLPCDMLILAGGLMAPPLIKGLGLPTDEAGRLRVTPSLHAPDDPDVFAAGDCAVIEGAARPPAGVFGVRAAPILAANLIARARGAPLRAYDPQRRWLSIMDLGDGTGLALRGGLWWRGRTALWLKRRLDLGFVAKARSLRPDA